MALTLMIIHYVQLNFLIGEFDNRWQWGDCFLCFNIGFYAGMTVFILDCKYKAVQELNTSLHQPSGVFQTIANPNKTF